MKYFISDTHFGHENILKFGNRPFETLRQMEKTILKNLNTTLEKGDILYHLGDLAWTKEGFDTFFHGLRKDISIFWIAGNHDRRVAQYASRIIQMVDLKEIKIQKNKTTLCHYPLVTWPSAPYNGWHLYGHIHKNTGSDKLIGPYLNGKTMNVNVEYTNYRPVSEDKIVEYMLNRPDNWDYIKKEENNDK